MELLGVALHEPLQYPDVGLAGAQEGQTLLVELGAEDHALLFRLAGLHRLEFGLEGKQLVHVLPGGGQVVLLLGAVAQVADDGKAGEQIVLRVFGRLHGEGGEQRDGLVKAAQRAVGVGGVQPHGKRDVLIPDGELQLGLVVAQKALRVQLVIQPGQKLAVHVERRQVLGDHHDGQTNGCNQQHGNRIGGAVEREVNAHQGEIAGAEDQQALFALGKEMNHDTQLLEESIDVYSISGMPVKSNSFLRIVRRQGAQLRLRPDSGRQDVGFVNLLRRRMEKGVVSVRHLCYNQDNVIY